MLEGVWFKFDGRKQLYISELLSELPAGILNHPQVQIAAFEMHVPEPYKGVVEAPLTSEAPKAAKSPKKA